MEEKESNFRLAWENLGRDEFIRNQDILNPMIVTAGVNNLSLRGIKNTQLGMMISQFKIAPPITDITDIRIIGVIVKGSDSVKLDRGLALDELQNNMDISRRE